MLLKIIRAKEGFGSTQIIECSEVKVIDDVDDNGRRYKTIWYQKKDVNGLSSQGVTVGDDEGFNVDVYVMNNEGKTVDRYKIDNL